MKKIKDMDHLLLFTKSLANPIRLKILTVLSTSGYYVSELAREIEISRALLYLHLKKLEEAELVYSNMKISPDGKALKYYYINSFDLLIDNNLIVELTSKEKNESKEN